MRISHRRNRRSSVYECFANYSPEGRRGLPRAKPFVFEEAPASGSLVKRLRIGACVHLFAGDKYSSSRHKAKRTC
jgi:hypothetical protein